MYRVYADDILIHDDQAADNIRIISPKLILEASAAGSFTFTLLENNPGYDTIQRFTTEIKVQEISGKSVNEIWAGRVIQEDEDFWKNRRFTCEGELSYLNDTLQLPHEYHNITIENFLGTLLNNHNAKVSDKKKFYVGYIDPEISLLPKDESGSDDVPEYIKASGLYDPSKDYFREDGNGGWVQVYFNITYLPGNPPIPVYPDITNENVYIKNPEYVDPNIPEYIEAEKPYNPSVNTYYIPNENNYYKKVTLAPVDYTPYNSDGAVIEYNNEIHTFYGSRHMKWNGTDWVEVSVIPFDFQHGCAVVYNGNIHLLGGNGTYMTGGGYTAGTVDSSVISKLHYVWDGSTWTRKELSLPYSFMYGGAVVQTNGIHIFGGLNSSGGAIKKHYVWRDGDTSWSTATALPYGFANGCVINIFDSAFHILGGSTSGTKHYKFDGNRWSSVSTLPYNFVKGAACYMDGEIHILGGKNNGLSHYIYTTNNEWLEASQLPYEFVGGGVAVIEYDTRPYHSKKRIHFVGGEYRDPNAIVIQIASNRVFYIWENLEWILVYTYPTTVYVKNPKYVKDKDTLYRFTNYETTLTCILEKIVSRLGGHIRITKKEGKRYIDYYKNEAATSSQIVEFGTNLLDFTKNWDLTDFATVIIPLGAAIEHDEDWDGDEDHPKALTDYTTVETVNDGSRYVISQEAYERFGRIEKTVSWDDVHVPKNLLRKANKYLTDYQFDKMTLVVSAVDLHFIDKVNVQGFKLLDNVRILSRVHGLDRYFLVTKITISLDSPESTEYTFGEVTEGTLTSMVNK